MNMRTRLLCATSAFLLVAIGFSGCAAQEYTTPPGGADLAALAEGDIKKELQRQPAASFPAHMAFVRVQAANYHHYDPSAYGRGKYTVLTTREVAEDRHLKRITDWPQLAGLAPMNRMVIPNHLSSFKQMRLGAAKVHADLLLAYTFDTNFRIDNHDIPPLEVITLGFLPNNEAQVTTTASAVIYDVRTGYVYGLAEATAKQSELASAWDEDDAIEDARIATEKEAFDKLINEMETTWTNVVAQYAHRAPKRDRPAIDSSSIGGAQYRTEPAREQRKSE